MKISAHFGSAEEVRSSLCSLTDGKNITLSHSTERERGVRDVEVGGGERG